MLYVSSPPSRRRRGPSPSSTSQILLYLSSVLKRALSPRSACQSHLSLIEALEIDLKTTRSTSHKQDAVVSLPPPFSQCTQSPALWSIMCFACVLRARGRLVLALPLRKGDEAPLPPHRRLSPPRGLHVLSTTPLRHSCALLIFRWSHCSLPPDPPPLSLLAPSLVPAAPPSS